MKCGEYLTGVRAESDKALLPYFTLGYKISPSNSLRFTYSSSVIRPSMYALNSFVYYNGPFSVSKGNPDLTPEFSYSLSLEHSVQFRNNFLATKLFYEFRTDVIENMSFLRDGTIVESQVQNLGSVLKRGVQLAGSVRFGNVSLNHSMRLYNQTTKGNSLAQEFGIKESSRMVFECDLSSVISFENNYALAFLLQYGSAKNNIQNNVFSDALYFISFDKTFKNNIKAGVVSALPFVRSFLYQGSDTNAPNFSASYTGNLQLPAIPIMLRLSYQFSSGSSRGFTNRSKGDLDKRSKPGL